MFILGPQGVLATTAPSDTPTAPSEVTVLVSPDTSSATPVDNSVAPPPASADSTAAAKPTDGTAATTATSGMSSSPNTTSNQAVGSTRQALPQPDPSTGALVYRYPLTVPPGRGGLTPDLSFTYNSQAGEEGSPFGYGWSLPIPSIQRQNRHGADQLYALNDFTSSLSGELVDIGSGVFAAKVDGGDFLTYTLGSNTWTVRDKKGTVYTFGATAQARQDNPSDATQVYKWMLERVQDTNGNFIHHEYYKDQGQVYPSAVHYTGSGTTDGPFSVAFAREARTDPYTNYSSTFAVATQYRINLVQVFVASQLVHKYQLAYTTGSNHYRSLLATITETGYSDSGADTSLPPTAFSYTQSTPVWQQSASWQYSPPYSNRVRVGSANSDGFSDFLMSYDPYVPGYGNPVPPVQISDVSNTRTGWWNTGVPPVPPIFFDKASYCGWSAWTDGGVITDDFNGDFLTDMVKSFGHEEPRGGAFVYDRDAYVNVSGQAWAQSLSFNPTVVFDRRCYTGPYSASADMNGDGLTDIVGSLEATPWLYALQLNTGSSFASPTTNWLPTGLTQDYVVGPGGRMLDVNRDGLADNLQTFVLQGVDVKYAYLSAGTGAWFERTNWRSPLPFTVAGGDNAVQFADMNADGLVDIVQASNPYPGSVVTYLNTGNGWQRRQDWEPTNPGSWSNTTKLMDVNADGLVDFMTIGAIPTHLGTGTVADILNGIAYSTGSSTAVAYKASTQYRPDPSSWDILNPKLPFVLQTVNQISTNDGFGNVGTTTYTYEGGEYYYGGPFDRKFAGFAKITKIDPVGNTTTTFYHQGNATNSVQGEFDDNPAKIGYLYRVEQRDAAGNLYGVTITQWDRFDKGSGASFVKKARQTSLTYDGNATRRDTTEEFTYDNATGNALTRTLWGEVQALDDGSFTDIGSDKLVTTNAYATGGSYGVVGAPSSELTVDQAAANVAESRLYYDTLALGSVDKGNVTKAEQWVSGSTYVNTQKTYNSYGLVSQELDARGKATNYTYDVYNLYPATVTNALNQAVQYVYDYSAGKPVQVTDANGYISQVVFDGLDRVIEEKQPDPAAPATLVTKSAYAYTDTPLLVNVHKTDYLDASTSVDAYTYFDGLGRPIQQRQEAEAASTFNVTDILYNSRGLTDKQSLPYTSTGYARTAATTTAALLTSYSYDAVGRVTTATNVVGASMQAYEDWVNTSADPRGNITRHYSDAYGKLVQVDEVNGASTYVTRYNYSSAGNLVQITDALGNVRSFTYDGLARRLTAQDLHAPADITFGTWQYIYDNAGNLTSRTDAKNQVTLYTYDDVNRGLTEDFQGQAGTEVTNTYDTCLNGIGRLCGVTSTGAAVAMQYNALGQQTREIKTISATPYQTDYTYDRQDTQLTIASPDGSQVKYLYNTAGQLEQVQRQEAADASFMNVVANFDYGPAGSITIQADANGTTTTNMYDAGELYRLRRKLTTNGGGTKLQDITYTYDADGNITHLTDASQTNSAKIVDYTYDALNRLLTAATTGAANGQNYSEAYTYDAIGNILTKTGQGVYTYAGNLGASYANPHAVTQVGSTAYSYDNNGNLTSRGSSLPWYPPAGGAWSDRRQLTIDHIKVAGGQTLVDFPMLVSLTDAALRTIANGGKVGKSDGTDIIFTSADGTTKLNHELESYDGLTGTLVAWVRVPQLSAATDTNLVVYFGNPAAADQQNKAGTWNSNYAAVYHLGGTVGENDSTGNALGLSQAGTVLSTSGGRFAKARELTVVNSANYLTTADAPTLDDQQQMTFQAWINKTDAATAWRGYMSKRGSATSQYSYALGVSSSLLNFATGKNVTTQVPCATKNNKTSLGLFYLAASGSQCTRTDQLLDTTLASASQVTPSAWTKVDAVFDGSQASASRKKLYLQGALNATGSATSTVIPNTSVNLNVFRTTGDAGGWQGKLDEVRILKTALGAGWLQTEYNNENNPGTFYSFGPVTLAGGGDSFTWDYANRLTASSVGSSVESYAYDASGQRVKYTVGSTTTTYPTMYYNTDGTTAQKHIFANGTDVGTIKGTGASAAVYYTHTDHLTGSNVVTSSTGVQQELVDYYPFGSIRLDEKAGSFSEQRKFTGQEYDVDTGLSYMNARYYNGSLGRFISQDPLAIEALQTEDNKKFQYLLASPQNWNTYSYALNNPLVASDPSGLLTIMVPGTVLAGSAADRDLQWVSSDLYKSVANTFHEAPYLFGGYMGWNGSDNDHARGIAADKLSEFINNYHFSDGEKLNIVGYSHGGNVALEATHNLNHTIDNLVTYNTPIRDDYSPDVSKIGNFIQLFNTDDKVQNHAGGEFSVTGLLGFMLNGPLGFKAGNALGWGQFGQAGRASPYADYTFNFAGKVDNKGSLNAHNMPLNGGGSKALWNDVVSKYLLK